MLAGIYIKLIAAAIIVAAVVGGYLYVRNLQDTVTELTVQMEVCGGKVRDQNAAIEALRLNAEARQKAAEVAIAEARAQTKKAQGKATVIYKTAPSTPGDDCKSALDLINGTMIVEVEKAEKAALDMINGSKK